MDASDRPLFWIGSSLDDLRNFPEDVTRVMGFALRRAQDGGKHVNAKPLKGFGGADVLEIVEDDDGNTYRAVYAVKFAGVILCSTLFRRNPRKASLRQSTRSIL